MFKENTVYVFKSKYASREFRETGPVNRIIYDLVKDCPWSPLKIDEYGAVESIKVFGQCNSHKIYTSVNIHPAHIFFTHGEKRYFKEFVKEDIDPGLEVDEDSKEIENVWILTRTLGNPPSVSGPFNEEIAMRTAKQTHSLSKDPSTRTILLKEIGEVHITMEIR